MAQYTNKFVDERYSNLLEKNLFPQSVLIPGVTYSTSWQGDAASGAVKIYKLTSGAVTVGTPGRDFTHVDGANTLLTLALDKNFQRSRKLYKVQMNAVSYDMASLELSLAVKEVSKAWQAQGVLALEAGSTDMADITALTKDNIYGYMVDGKQVLVENDATPDVVMVSPAVYSLLLKSPEFIKASNLGDYVVQSGAVGQVAGLLVYSTNFVSATTDFIIYDHETLAIATNLEAMRMMETPDFVGTLAQVEMNSGYLVTNTERALIKKNT